MSALILFFVLTLGTCSWYTISFHLYFKILISNTVVLFLSCRADRNKLFV